MCLGEEMARPALIEAVAAGDMGAVRSLLAGGARVNAATRTGKTALIEAAERGSVDATRLLIAAKADLNVSDRGVGTALEAPNAPGIPRWPPCFAKRATQTSGRSIGDTVCVRPWKGDGYCGVVAAVSEGEYRLRVTAVIGCRDGCAARADCSAGRPVGGSEGLTEGRYDRVPTSCLTHTGVKL